MSNNRKREIFDHGCILIGSFSMTNLPLEGCVWYNGRDCLIVWDGWAPVLVMANKAAAADDAMILLRRQILNPRVDQILNTK